MSYQRAIHVLMVLSLVVMAFVSQPGSAQPIAQGSSDPKQTPVPSDLASLLRPDGTLDIPAEAVGNIDVDGWSMTLDTDDQPHFSRTQDVGSISSADDKYWSHNFLLGAYDSSGDTCVIHAMAISGNYVYIGGNFDTVGSTKANNIARWDNLFKEWTALGSGVDELVMVITVIDDYVYAGGYFTQAGGVSTGPLARWDAITQTWSEIGTLTYEFPDILAVYAISVSPSGELYVGGRFSTVDGFAVGNIARKTASGWDDLDGGVSGDPSYVRAMGITAGGRVYVGGEFTKAGTQLAQNLAVWTGTTWNTVGGGVGPDGSAVNALAIKEEFQVYVGGTFFEAYDGLGHTEPVQFVAYWDGGIDGSSSNWGNLAGGLNGAVETLDYKNDILYLGGLFTQSKGLTPLHYVARWVGYWVSVENTHETVDGVDDYVFAVAADDTFLFVGGTFDYAGDYLANHVAGFYINGVRWLSLGSSVNATVSALAVSSDGSVYIGGRFSVANGIEWGGSFSPFMAKYNVARNEWYFLGNAAEINGCTGGAGCIPEVNAILIDGNKVYVAGNFTRIGNLTVNGIAWYDYGDQASGWHALETATGTGVTCSSPCAARVRALATLQGDLYVGGYFTFAGGTAASNIAYWDGDSWHSLQGGSGGLSGQVYALSPLTNGSLAIGGSFSSVCAIQTPCPNLVMYFRSAWNRIGNSAVNGVVYTILEGDTSTPLYIGGSFSSPFANIARLGKTGLWAALGNNLNNPVRALAHAPDGGIYAGGNFAGPGAVNLWYIAHWKYNTWSPLGSGMNNPVYTLASYRMHLFAGGVFTGAGGYPSYFFADWNTTKAIYLPVIVK